MLDKTELMHAISPATAVPRARRTAAAPRARPKTIHVDSGALHAAEGMLGSKQSSSSNLTGEWDNVITYICELEKDEHSAN